MALVTKYYLVEQIRSLLGGGSPSAGAKFEPKMIESFLQQVINKKLKTEYFSVTLPSDETIPEGLVLASYDSVPVTAYKGLSRARLPAMPISLRRGMGVYFVGPHIEIGGTPQLATPVLVTDTVTSSTVLCEWSAITGAELYVLERADDATFVTNVVTIYGGNRFSFNNTGLTTDKIYYYRLKAIGTGYLESNYGYAGATPSYSNIFDNSFDSTFK